MVSSRVDGRQLCTSITSSILG
uniref:Uncharacterized protein n=1 Tax=Tetranychus urticae TaxID=32264 RepID=T1L2Z4_TETUR